MLIELSWQEQLFAAQAGCMRRISAIARDRPAPYGQIPLDLWGNDIESSGAELAVAKALGMYWDPVNAKPASLPGDVGELQVRSTRREHGCLILHDRDKDEAKFVLVCGVFPQYDLVGWIHGAEGKADCNLKTGDGRPAYFVPQTKLNSIDLLLIGS